MFVVDMIQKKVTIFTFIKLLALPQHQGCTFTFILDDLIAQLECESLAS